MKDAGVDEDSTKLATLEQLIGFVKEKIIRIDHDDPIILHKTPCVEFVQCQFESLIEIVLILVRIVQVLHSHHLRPIFMFTESEKKNKKNPPLITLHLKEGMEWHHYLINTWAVGRRQVVHFFSFSFFFVLLWKEKETI